MSWGQQGWWEQGGTRQQPLPLQELGSVAWLSACLGVGGSPSCSLPREGSWCGFLVGEEVQDQAQPMSHISVG